MREILFRGKLESGAWVYGSLVQAPGFVGIIERDEERYDYPYMDSTTGCIDGNACIVDPDTVGQYTGLTDKNGTRIFEGDVVRATLKTSKNTRPLEWPAAPVDYNGSSFGLAFKSNSGFVRLDDFAPTVTLEVIGSVHDNLELMEVDHAAD